MAAHSLCKVLQITQLYNTICKGRYYAEDENLTRFLCRAIAQAVSRWLPTAAARVRAQVWSSGICGGQSGVGAGFLRVLRFPLPIFIPPNSPPSQSPGVVIQLASQWPTCRVDSVWTPPPIMVCVFYVCNFILHG
jgi:hypothetical protein